MELPLELKEPRLFGTYDSRNESEVKLESTAETFAVSLEFWAGDGPKTRRDATNESNISAINSGFSLVATIFLWRSAAGIVKDKVVAILIGYKCKETEGNLERHVSNCSIYINMMKGVAGTAPTMARAAGHGQACTQPVRGIRAG